MLDARLFFRNKRVLVTGACGTIGSELINQMLGTYDASEVIGIDNNESGLFFLEQRFSKYSNASFFLADIRDKDKLNRVFQGVDIVFHAAAFKHVILCERSPFEAVQTNILGVQNVITEAMKCGVERVIFMSSDKAVNPTNVMGTSKLMCEKLITAFNTSKAGSKCVMASTRFGNVLGSRGSVIPIFREQIRKGGPVTLTDADMTRFIMSISQAVRLVIDSAVLACGGEVFITKMPVIAIETLARVMIDILGPQFGHNQDGIEIEIIGTKPGEKMYEELMTQDETLRAWELPDYFAVLPPFSKQARSIKYAYPKIVSETVDNAYHSANEVALSVDELKAFLLEHKLVEEALPEGAIPINVIGRICTKPGLRGSSCTPVDIRKEFMTLKEKGRAK